MKLLVTGVTGQVGHELVRSLQPLGEIVATGEFGPSISALPRTGR